MIIGVDWTPAVRQQAGIGRFTRDLVTAVLAHKSDFDYRLIVTKDSMPKQPPSGATIVPLPFTERQLNVLWHRLRLPLPLELFTGRLDVFHGTNFLLPPLRNARGVLTVHDLTYLVHPEFAEPSLAAFLTKAVPFSLQRASRICADSESTRDDLLRLLGVGTARVTVVYGAAGRVFRPVRETPHLDRVRKAYGISGPFLLALGTREPRKNLAGLLAAYEYVRDAGIAISLLIAGPAGWREEGHAQRLKESPYAMDVRSLGYVPDDDLPALFSLTDCFVYPSFYEGFGLPVLEALACGAPVVTSGTSSMPEIGGSVAHYARPSEPEDIARAILEVLRSPTERARAADSGPRQAALFSWERSAEQLREIYRSVASG